MSEETKTNEPVKQEGDFKIKSKKPKQLGNKEQEIKKVNLKEPLVQLPPEVTKVVVPSDELKKEDDAIQIGETEKVDVGEQAGDSIKVDEQVSEPSPVSEIKEEVKPIEEVVEEEIQQGSLITPSAITTIYNPFNFKTINDKANEVNTNIPDSPYLIHVGRLAKQKRHDILFSAFAKLDKKYKCSLQGDYKNKDCS